MDAAKMILTYRLLQDEDKMQSWQKKGVARLWMWPGLGQVGKECEFQSERVGN